MGDDHFPDDWSDTDKQAASVEPLAWMETETEMPDDDVAALKGILERNMGERDDGATIGVPDSIDPDLSELV
jgi:hypothetical protein